LCAPLGVPLRLLDPRLTARPGRPTIDPQRGAARLGPELDRGGILFVPEGYNSEEPAPLMVALHGAGGTAQSWARLYDHCEERGIVLLAPDSRARTWDVVLGGYGPDVRFIDRALEYTFERCAIDPEHIALVGFSDGASYALSLGPSNGDLFTHLIAWSPGFSSPEDPIVGRPLVYISHGSEDRVLPVRLSRDALAPMFEMDGYDMRYDEFSGRHEMPEPIIAASLEWFLT
jgi:phospholipase/carboxylesterase